MATPGIFPRVFLKIFPGIFFFFFFARDFLIKYLSIILAKE